MIFNLFLKIWDFELGDSYKLISYKRKSVNKVHIRDGYKLYYAVTERNRFIFNQTFELNWTSMWYSWTYEHPIYF